MVKEMLIMLVLIVAIIATSTTLNTEVKHKGHQVTWGR